MASIPTRIPRAYLLTTFVVLVLFLMSQQAGGRGGYYLPDAMKLTTWNVAAINNNPFEYWITGGTQYNNLMQNFAREVQNPTAAVDYEVGELFTDAMLESLFDEMAKAGWKDLDSVRSRYETDLRHRRAVSGFLKDKLIGKKRLISMFDRVTNTINTEKGPVYRPTAVNCYSKDLSDVKVWWDRWINFVFREKLTVRGRKGAGVSSKLVREMLQPILKAKYPAVTDEEAPITIPLQTLHGAIFDAVLLNTLNTLDKNWQRLRNEMCDKLNRGKVGRTVSILSAHYADSEVIFLQESSEELVATLKNHPLSSSFNILTPENFDRDRNQNSVILTRKGHWDSHAEITPAVLAKMEGKSVGKGDLFVLKALHKPTGVETVLASFHGDTNGLLTVPVVEAVAAEAGGKRLLFGLDANTHEKGDTDRQGVDDFAQFFVSKDLNSCWGENPNPRNYTTFHARTHLQSQLNKAVTYEEQTLKGDRHPKDFILFPRSDFSLKRTAKDNTGEGYFVEETVFPTLNFPSDHGIVATWLTRSKTV